MPSICGFRRFARFAIAFASGRVVYASGVALAGLSNRTT
jgi:hypothetical protein